MGVCVVCLSRTGRDSRKSFHKFPFKKNPTVAEKWVEWVQKVKKSGWTPCRTSIVCSDHFAASAFDRSAFRVELNANSVPTIYDPNSDTATGLEAHTSEQISPLREICAESPLEKRRGENADICRPDSMAPKGLSALAKFARAEEIAESDATLKALKSAAESDVVTNSLVSSPKDECRTGRRRSLLFHDHNYEDSPMMCRKKNVELKKNLKKVRIINKAQKQKIKKLKDRVESLKQLVSTLRKQHCVCTKGLELKKD